MHREPDNRLTEEDLAILRLESPKIAGHTCKVIVVEPGPDGAPFDLEQLRSSIADRIDAAPMLLRKLDPPNPHHGHPRWVTDQDFDLVNHVLGYDADAPVDQDRFIEIVAELMATRLDRERPLWSIHVVELEDDRMGLVILLHHAMADGMTAVRIVSGILWDPIADAAGGQEHHPKTSAKGHSLPGDGSERVRMRSAVHRELLPSAVDTPLDRHPCEQRRVAVVASQLSDLKRIGHEVGEGATVNDVVLCAVAGGLRAWLERHGGSLEGVRIKVPVSLHDHDERSDALGNHDSFMVVAVGTEQPDPVERLRSIHAQTSTLKSAHDAQELDKLFSELRHVSGLASHALEKWSNNPRVFTINVSNVPGPRTPVAVLGGEVSELFTLAEIGDRHALRVSVISLGDSVSFGLCSDADAVGDLDVVAQGIERDLETLRSALP